MTPGPRALAGRLRRAVAPSSPGPADPPGPPADGLGPRRHEPNPADPEPLPGVRLCAVVKTWEDEDLVEAVVHHAFAQGADAVHLVDNGSTDSTVARAEAAGATVAEVYHTEAFDGPMAQTLMNAVAAHESLRLGDEHVWWLYLDSDEFPEGPDGTTLRQYLDGLDRRFRVVGSTTVNHLPDRRPTYVSGFHPGEFQELGYVFEPSWSPPCGLPHWKHPLQRFDRRGPFLVSRAGAHWALCPQPLVEPSIGIVTHHYQYRDEALTRAKLARTVGPDARTGLYGRAGTDGFSRRVRSLDAVYRGRWAEVETEAGRTLDPQSALRPWPATVRRWYPQSALDTALARTDAPLAGPATCGEHQ